MFNLFEIIKIQQILQYIKYQFDVVARDIFRNMLIDVNKFVSIAI